MKNTTEEERKEARKEYLKQWYETNKEKITKYRQANKEKIAEYHKQYYQANKEKIVEYNKQRYQDDKEKILEQRKQYQQDNKEKIAERNKQYRKNNAEKIAEKKKQYNNTQFGRAVNLVSTHNQEDKKYNRGECSLTSLWVCNYIFPFKCIYCGEDDWTKLGCDRKDNSLPHTPSNVVPCCEACNKKRHLKPFEEFVAECNAQKRLKEWEEFLKQK